MRILLLFIVWEVPTWGCDWTSVYWGGSVSRGERCKGLSRDIKPSYNMSSKVRTSCEASICSRSRGAAFHHKMWGVSQPFKVGLAQKFGMLTLPSGTSDSAMESIVICVSCTHTLSVWRGLKNNKGIIKLSETDFNNSNNPYYYYYYSTALLLCY